VTEPPAATLAPPSVLVTFKSGAALTGVVSVPELLVVTNSPVTAGIVAVLLIVFKPAGTVPLTFSAKMTVPLTPGATLPTVYV